MWTRIKRLIKHSWSTDSAKALLTEDVLSRLALHVQTSELLHRGEIRIYVEGSLPLAYLWADQPLAHIIRARAVEKFADLHVWDTSDNTGVLIYLLLAERRIELVADRGINACVSAGTWPVLVAHMQHSFKSGAYEQGLTLAVDAISQLLVAHFPSQPGASNPNELPDVPVLGN